MTRIFGKDKTYPVMGHDVSHIGFASAPGDIIHANGLIVLADPGIMLEHKPENILDHLKLDGLPDYFYARYKHGDVEIDSTFVLTLGVLILNIKKLILKKKWSYPENQKDLYKVLEEMIACAKEFAPQTGIKEIQVEAPIYNLDQTECELHFLYAYLGFEMMPRSKAKFEQLMLYHGLPYKTLLELLNGWNGHEIWENIKFQWRGRIVL